MAKGNSALLLGGVAALAALVMLGGAKRDELAEAAELADKQKRPEKVKPKQEKQDATQVSAPVQQPEQKHEDVEYIEPGRGAVQLPAGYSAAAARAEAPALAKHIRAKQWSYTRQAVKTFQTHAGLKADGIYGPQTASALTYWAGTPAPKPLFKGSNAAYAPPEGI